MSDPLQRSAIAADNSTVVRSERVLPGSLVFEVQSGAVRMRFSLTDEQIAFLAFDDAPLAKAS